MSWAEAKWTVDSLLQKIGQAPNNMRSFIAYSLSATSIGLKFQEPADSYDANNNLICSVGGVMIRMSDTGYPTKPSEGTLVVNNTNLGAYINTPFTVSGLTKGKKYYFSAFPYSVQGVYNLSSNAANRADATPAAGEIANVTISIDDDSAFSSVVVTCVDETESASTQSATLTKTKKTASFVVPIGHTYHIEYGAEDGYSKPDNTTPKVSVAGTTSNYTATYYYFTATIAVTYPAGATCTCECGSTKYTAPNTSGSHTFQVHNVGTWTVKAVSGSDTDSTSVSITSSGQSRSVELSFAKIYGISRDITATSPAWARTDSAIGKAATATVGTTAGRSDFDNCYPWSGISRETLSTGDVMVKIPKFWYRRYRNGNVEYLKIADNATSGFTLHPAFNHGGVAKDYLYVGAYKTSSDDKSASGVTPWTGRKREITRSGAKEKGTGWGILDIAALSAIQMLILVEFANNNVQSVIGRGYCDSNPTGFAIITGTCNNVSGLTGRPAGTDGEVDVVWRGIEGLWGNVWEWVDGVNCNNGTYYVCNDPSKYADDTTTNYTALSFKGSTTWTGKSYITQEGLDTGSNPHVMLPSAAGSGSETTYECDTCGCSTEWRVFQHGGSWEEGSGCGLFTALLNQPSSAAYSSFGSRLLYIPS